VVWEATNDFSSYLLNRIRNEKKALSKKKQWSVSMIWSVTL
jgi:hypothetical protein